MGKEIADFSQMLETLEKASGDPKSVSVGSFASAIQNIQAELRLMEKDMDRLGASLKATFKDEAEETPPSASAAAPEADIQAEATKP